MTPDQASVVLSLINSTETSLKSLAEMSGLSLFSFYQGAELRSLDLSNQDLTGMNFDRADIRFSDLSGSDYDAGAFNGSLIDDQQSWLQDEYEFYMVDVFNHPIDEILIFCKFRPGLIDHVFNEGATTYGDFATIAGVSENALRKARRGQVVAHETALRILGEIRELGDRQHVPYPTPHISAIMRQPIVEFLSGGINMPFRHVSRERLKELIKMRAEILSVRELIYPNSIRANWRDTPEFIEIMLDYYRGHRERLLGRNSD